VQKVIVRELEERDYEVFKRLFDEAFLEYLEFLKRGKTRQYMKELRGRREISRSGFDFYLRTGSSFVAEENGEAVGYIASQRVPSMHGVDLWIEYVVIRKEFRRRRIGLALLQKLIDYAVISSIDRIYAFINPDNEPSMRLHSRAGFNVEDWKIAVYETKERFASSGVASSIL
jgi:L-amino acid N-acyltransferase YncA